MELDLLALLEGRVDEVDRTSVRVGGVVLGTVSDVDDPLSLGRVKVRFPWLSSDAESAWAPIAVPWAGSQMGAYFAPQVHDEVVAAFDHGDLKHPIVIGFLWGTSTRPPEATPRAESRELKSKSGHRLHFEDLPGVGAITVESGGGHKVRLDDTPPGTITVEHSSGTLKITVDTSGITISANSGDISLSAPSGSVRISGATVDIGASGTATLKGGVSVSIKGALVEIN